MSAACYVGEGQLTVMELAPRDPGPGEVAIDVAYTGICGTDLHILHGAMDARVTLPAVLGHEMSGTIAHARRGCERLVGRRSRHGDAARLVRPLPGVSRRASAHLPQPRLPRHRLAGFDAGELDGPAGRARGVAADAFAEDSALAEPTAVAVHDVRRSGLREGERALVVGGGPIGVLIACVARPRAPSARGRAERAAACFRAVARTARHRSDRRRRPAFVADWTDGAGADVAFEVSGAIAGIETAIQSLAVRGRLVVVAIHGTPPPVNLFRVFWRELTLIGARVYERSDFEEAVRAAGERARSRRSMVSGIEPLTSVAAAFSQLESGRAMKMLDRLPGGRLR
jgi:(R,R)-butanediol dehydrogenase/meso-butanediol dehydrogenase/diacetyl reductase